MENPTATASAVVSLAEQLEDRSAQLYERMSEQFPDHKKIFKDFARENRLNKVLIVRTYQETVTDALETAYAFEGLNLEGAIPSDFWKERLDFPGAVSAALTLERAAAEFYANVASRSRTLLSTIYVAFKKVEEARKSRLTKLESLQGS